MLSSIGRAAIRRSGARAAVGATATSTTRVVRRNLNLSGTNLLHQFASQFARSFATATITTKVKTTKSASVKPTAKTTKKAPVKKPAKKAAKKPLKKKPVKKKPVKKKPVAKKPKAKKVLSEADKKKREVKTLKALVLAPPKLKPQTVWTLILHETPAGEEGRGKVMVEASTKYKSLSTAELEAYNHKVNENKLQNEKTYASWLETLTPEQVRISNAARYNLTLKKVNTRRPIVDSRLPKRPVLAFSSFTKDRWASGDFKNISIVDASKQMGLEWKALSEAEKKPYLDRSEEDRRRYKIEYKTVFGHDSATNKQAFREAKKEGTS